jgi:hypothetical protein
MVLVVIQLQVASQGPGVAHYEDMPTYSLFTSKSTTSTNTAWNDLMMSESYVMCIIITIAFVCLTMPYRRLHTFSPITLSPNAQLAGTLGTGVAASKGALCKAYLRSCVGGRHSSS